MKNLSKAFAAAIFFTTATASAQQTTPTPAITNTPPPPAPPAPPPTPVADPATPPPPPAAITIKPAPPAPPVQRRVTTPVIAAGAIGAAGLATGIVFGILAAGKNQDYKKKANNDVALDGERNAFISDVAFGVAALFGLTAIALYMLPDEPTPSATGSTAPSNVAKHNVKTWVFSALTGEVLSF